MPSNQFIPMTYHNRNLNNPNITPPVIQKTPPPLLLPPISPTSIKYQIPNQTNNSSIKYYAPSSPRMVQPLSPTIRIQNTNIPYSASRYNNPSTSNF